MIIMIMMMIIIIIKIIIITTKTTNFADAPSPWSNNKYNAQNNTETTS